MKVDLSFHVHEEACCLCVVVTSPYGGICRHTMAGLGYPEVDEVGRALPWLYPEAGHLVNKP